MTVGMLIRPETCQTRGKISRNSSQKIFFIQIRIFMNICQILGKRFTKFTLLKEYHPKRRLTKIEATAKPDHVWPEVWTKIGNTAQNREKQELGKRKNKARQCSKTEMKLHYRSRRRRVQRKKKKVMRKVEDPWLQPCRAKDNQAPRKWLRSF